MIIKYFYKYEFKYFTLKLKHIINNNHSRIDRNLIYYSNLNQYVTKPNLIIYVKMAHALFFKHVG